MRLPFLASLLSIALVFGTGAACAAQSQGAKSAKAAKDQKAVPSIFHITGTVLNTVTQSPVSGSRLTATLVGRSQGSQSPSSDEFTTDEQGHFDVSVPSAGAWRLTARARGYVTQSLNAHENFSSDVVLTPETPTLDVTFPLMPNSSIFGTVLDEASEPIRGARITLQAVPVGDGDSGQELPTVRGAAMTDDRGHYELPNLPPGEYRAGVQAQVWYAMAVQSTRTPSSGSAPADPSLDVVYPITWFPGVTDPASAATITLHGGDSGEADFHLVPMPAVHLRVPQPASSGGTGPNGRQVQSPGAFPQIRPVATSGIFGGMAPPMISSSGGQVDTGGLSPGLYQVTWPGSDGAGERSSLIQITANSGRSLDINAASVGVHLSLQMDGTAARNPGQITFVDVSNPLNVFRVNEMAHPIRGRRGGGESAALEQRPDIGIDVIPGRYRVLLSSDRDQYLTGITATGAEASGALVTVHGDASLTLHITSGKPSVTGFVRYQDKPSVGAQILLVPATFGEPESLTVVRRDQSNTDGSYDLGAVIPGQYILVAIDHGWQVNWNDPATLRLYLMHGIPLDLRSGANIRQEIQAQAP